MSYTRNSKALNLQLWNKHKITIYNLDLEKSYDEDLSYYFPRSKYHIEIYGFWIIGDLELWNSLYKGLLSSLKIYV